MSRIQKISEFQKDAEAIPEYINSSSGADAYIFSNEANTEALKKRVIIGKCSVLNLNESIFFLFLGFRGTEITSWKDIHTDMKFIKIPFRDRLFKARTALFDRGKNSFHCEGSS